MRQTGTRTVRCPSRSPPGVGRVVFISGDPNGIAYDVVPAGEEFDPRLEVTFDHPRNQASESPNRFPVKQAGYFEEFEFEKPRDADPEDSEKVVTKPDETAADDG